MRQHVTSCLIKHLKPNSVKVAPSRAAFFFQDRPVPVHDHSIGHGNCCSHYGAQDTVQHFLDPHIDCFCANGPRKIASEKRMLMGIIQGEERARRTIAGAIFYLKTRYRLNDNAGNYHPDPGNN